MRLFLFFLLLSLSFRVDAQFPHLNNYLKMELSEKLVPEKPYTILVQGNMERLLANEKKMGYVINYYSGNIASISCGLSYVARLIDEKIIFYAELVKPRARPMNDTMVVRNRIQPVKTGQAPLSQAYDGSGIVMGIIDTGIDVAHKDFKDAQGNTRIKFLWDQKTSAGSPAPLPFNYGVEWTSAQIDAELCTHSDMQYWGHGTHVSGIAAGNGLASGRYEGCAPGADLVVVAVDFSHNGPYTADAVKYIVDKAELLGKPCVINSSVGDYYGSHDATDLESKLIENLITDTTGRVMVAAAGNGGSEKFHVKTQSSAMDTSFTWIKNNYFALEYWLYGDSNQIKSVEISIGANRSNFSNLGRLPFKSYSYGLTQVQHDTLKHQGNRIGIIHNSSSMNPSGVYELYIKIEADSSNLLWRIESTGPGSHDSWNFDFVSSNLPSPLQYPPILNYVMPDTLYSLVSSYQCSDEVITVANYVNMNRYYDVTNTLRILPEVSGSLWISSSIGPTRDGRQKPDIAATGNNILSSLVSGMQASQIANSPQTVAQGSFHVLGGGTSASSPVVAGLAALYLQANPTASNRQVKTAITQCAYTDAFTGTTPNYGWGFGKLDGIAAMMCRDNETGITKNRHKISPICVPNPFHDKVIITLPFTIKGHIYVYNLEGKLLHKNDFEGEQYELNAHALTDGSPGLLFVGINSENDHYAFKLIHH